MSVNWNSPAVIAAVRQGAMQGVVQAIGIVEQHAVHLLTNPPKTGRVYRRRGVSHQASAPGEAPASDTGRLVGSRRIVFDQANIRARLIFADKKAAWLEHGTRRMLPRPWARRALFEKAREIYAAVAGGIRTALNHR